MIIAKSIAIYPLLTILTNVGKKSFENMGRIVKKSGDTVGRILRPGQESLDASKKIAQQIFANKKELFLAIDETTIKKIHARLIEGTSWFFDTKIGRSINAYRLLVGAISDGKYTVPINAAFTFGSDFYENPREAKIMTVQHFIATALSLFPDKKFIAVLDGAFASVAYLKWAIENGIRTEVRMHSNRVVIYKGEHLKLREIKWLRPKGRQMSRTIRVLWQGLNLYITAAKRIDKHGNETVVFQAATYVAKPNKHAEAYKFRWNIEKLFRTTKQSLGLQECFARKTGIQFNHICAVLLAYSMAQLEMKKKGFKNPEVALRAFEKKKRTFLNQSKPFLGGIIGIA